MLNGLSISKTRCHQSMRAVPTHEAGDTAVSAMFFELCREWHHERAFMEFKHPFRQICSNDPT